MAWRKRRARALRQAGSAPALHETGADGQRLHFVEAEHQRRQVEAGTDAVADARLAVDRYAGGQQRRHVAVDRALRHAQPLGKLACGGEPAPAEVLHDLEQAVGATHGSSGLRYGWLMTRAAAVRAAHREHRPMRVPPDASTDCREYRSTRVPTDASTAGRAYGRTRVPLATRTPRCACRSTCAPCAEPGSTARHGPPAPLRHPCDPPGAAGCHARLPLRIAAQCKHRHAAAVLPWWQAAAKGSRRHRSWRCGASAGRPADRRPGVLPGPPGDAGHAG